MGDCDRDESGYPNSGAEEPPSTTEVHRSNGARSASPNHRAGANQAKIFKSQKREEEAMSIGEYYQKKRRERKESLEKKWREVKLAHKNLKVITVGKKIKIRKFFIRLQASNCRGKAQKDFFLEFDFWEDGKGKKDGYDGGVRKEDGDEATRHE